MKIFVFRWKTLLMLSLLVLFSNEISSAQCTPQGGARGRVQIIDNVVVTDDGDMLRGAHGNYSNQVYGNLSWWTNMRDNYNLNALRLDIRITSPPSSNNTADMLNLESVFSKVDIAVDKAEEAGMYIIVDNHTSCCGKYNQTLAEAFWAEAAPRYKDRTHVIFELQNEPVAWTAENYNAAAIQFQTDMYNFIRTRAPNTHIILWSFANSTAAMKSKVDQAPSVDYSNASVGVHPYHTNSGTFSSLNTLRASYPVIITEFAECCSANLPLIWDYVETEGISWTYMDLRFLADGYGNYGDGVLDPGAWPLTWPADPHYCSQGPPPEPPDNTPPKPPVNLVILGIY